MSLLRSPLLLLALVSAAACSGAAPCGPDLCAGCCSADGICQPSSPTTCGSAGAQCMACGDGQKCEAGLCVDATCTAETDAELCERFSAACGSITATDRCGAERTVADCGGCVAPQSCGGSGAANSCGCAPETDAALCSRLGKTCGGLSVTDNCGAPRVVPTCGTCSSPEQCGPANTCSCAPEPDAALCARLGKTCGTLTAIDRCGAQRTVGSCGACSSPQTCGGSSVANVCGCSPETNAAFCAHAGKNCGSLTGTDNCGASRSVASCGTCPSMQTCGGGGTPNVCGTPACTPETDAALCARYGKTCGTFSATDNCGAPRTVTTCGTCPATQACGGSGTPNVCACIAETDAALCARLGKTCGTLTATDNCGAQRTVSSCGACAAPAVCGGAGTSNVCGCAPETDAALCTRLGNACGMVTTADNCGVSRTVASCGSCTAPLTCGGGGTPNSCGCTAETDAAFCARLFKGCGAVSGLDSCGSNRTVASCGTCSSPQTCGGGGTANVCGPSSIDAVCQKYGLAPGCDLCAYAATHSTPSCNHDPTCFRLSEGLLALGDGPDVSATTCTPGNECGTVAYPWCTVGLGLRQTRGPTLKIAAAAMPYSTGGVALSMRDGIDLEGGYEPTFAQPRDPTAHPTLIAGAAPLLSWPAGAAARIDGLGLRMQTPIASPYAGVVIDGTSRATLASVTLSGSVGVQYGVLITAADGGAGTVVVRDSTLSGGNAADSTAVRFDGRGRLAVAQSTVRAGDWYYSTSIDFDWENHGHQWGIAGRDCGAVELDRSTVVGNYARFARAVDLYRCASLSVDGGLLVGKGTYRFGASGAQVQSDAIAGIVTDSVPVVSISGATIQGVDIDAGIYSAEDPESSFGVLMMNSARVPCRASISGCHIKGGTYGETRTAVEADGVALTVTGSDLQGSAEPKPEGNYRYFYGVSIKDTFDAGSVTTLTGNPRIVGGDRNEPCYLYGNSYGVRVTAGDSVISGNTLIQGDLHGNCFDYGIDIEADGTHHITGNGTIAAASGVGIDTATGIAVNGRTLATVDISNNQRIAGNPDPLGSGGQNFGLRATSAHLTVLDNGLILGGPGDAYGVSFERSSTPVEVDMRRNAVYGGRERYAYVLGASFDGVQNSTVSENSISACDDPNPAVAPDAGCGYGARGLQVQWTTNSTFANNYVFSGASPMAVGCRLGCADDSTLTLCTQAPLSIVFANNACVASGLATTTPINDYAYGLQVLFWRAGDRPRLVDNLFDSGPAGKADLSISAYYGNTWQAKAFDLLNNDLVPRGAVPLFTSDAAASASTAAAVNALSNAAHTISANVSVSPMYQSESAVSPRAAGYHLDLSCSLGGLGTPVVGVTRDFDGQPRSATAPTIGPDECP